MMHVELPWELVEEILYRVPPRSLTRFKIVCKQWNTLFESKSFVNNHIVRVRPQFIVWNNSMMYSVSVNLNDDPKIEMRELPIGPYLNNSMHSTARTFDGLIMFSDPWLWKNKAAVWNPWLRQTKWIESQEDHFSFRGIGYGSGRPEKGYKILGSSTCMRKLSDDTIQPCRRAAIYKFETNEWKSLNAYFQVEISTYNQVSLNGNLYWPLFHHETSETLIHSFDFSKEIYKVFCVLPWNTNSQYKPQILSTFRKDRLSMLTKIIGTNNIEIWVTKNKIINDDDGENVTWIKYMTVSIPISLVCISYFIDNVYKKNLVMCCEDEHRKLCIYIVMGNASTKIQIGVDAKHFVNILSYVPSLLSVP